MAHQHWVSEFHHNEAPHVTTKVREVKDSSSKVLVEHRHATTVCWNTKAFNNNNACGPCAVSGPTCQPTVTITGPTSNYDRHVSEAYLFVKEENQCGKHKKRDDCIPQDCYVGGSCGINGKNPCFNGSNRKRHQYHKHCHHEKHFVEVKRTVNDCRTEDDGKCGGAMVKHICLN